MKIYTLRALATELDTSYAYLRQMVHRLTKKQKSKLIDLPPWKLQQVGTMWLAYKAGEDIEFLDSEFPK